MGWVLAMVLAAAAFAVVAFVLKAPRATWALIGAALLAGVAGYGVQANPSLSGSPKAPLQSGNGEGDAAMIAARRALQSESGISGNKWLVVGDGLFRNGQYAAASAIVLGAVRANPKDAEAWLALANALVAHADGTLTPASAFAFDRAQEAAPAHPGPKFFRGLAMAQSGQFKEARTLWADLLAQSPADAPWRADLQARLAQLDAFIQQFDAANGAR